MEMEQSDPPFSLQLPKLPKLPQPTNEADVSTPLIVPLPTSLSASLSTPLPTPLPTPLQTPTPIHSEVSMKNYFAAATEIAINPPAALRDYYRNRYEQVVAKTSEKYADQHNLPQPLFTPTPPQNPPLSIEEYYRNYYNEAFSNAINYLKQLEWEKRMQQQQQHLDREMQKHQKKIQKQIELQLQHVKNIQSQQQIQQSQQQIQQQTQQQSQQQIQQQSQQSQQQTQQQSSNKKMPDDGYVVPKPEFQEYFPNEGMRKTAHGMYAISTPLKNDIGSRDDHFLNHFYDTEQHEQARNEGIQIVKKFSKKRKIKRSSS